MVSSRRTFTVVISVGFSLAADLQCEGGPEAEARRIERAASNWYFVFFVLRKFICTLKELVD